MKYDKTDIFLKSSLTELCGFTPLQADIIITNHREKANEIISGLLNIAEQVNYLKNFYKEYE